MRIDRVRIENFRRFRVVDLELPDGVIALVGRNGAGKSSLLEAIGWCLYGHDAARTGKDLLKRRGAAPSDDVRVHLAFRHAGHAYEVTRELVGKSESHAATVKVDGKVVVASGAMSHKEASGYVERLFHMDRDAFFTSLVARQRELAALSDASPATRKRILIGLLRLDAVDAAIGEARTQRRDAKAQLVGLRAGMRDLAPLRDQLQQTRIQMEADARRIAEADARIGALVDEVEQVRERRDASRKRAEEWKLATAALAAVDERVARVRGDAARRQEELKRIRAAAAEAALLAPRVALLPAAKARAETLAALHVRHGELTRLRAEIQRAHLDAQRAAAEGEAARAALATAGAARTLAERIANERPKREAALLATQQRLVDLEGKARMIARQVNELAERERRVRDMGPESPCPTCTRPLREHHAELLHGFRAEMDALRASLAQATPELEAARAEETQRRASLQELAERDAELRAKLQKLGADEQRAADAAARLAEAQGRAARLAEQEKALAGEPFDPKEHDAARAALRELEAARDRHARLSVEAEREREVAPLLAELAAAEAAGLAERAETERRRAALGFEPAGHDALEKAATAAEARLTDARIARERAVNDRVRRADAEKALLDAIAQQEELAARAAALEARVLLLEQLAGEREQGLLPEFKDHLIGRIRPLLSLHAGRLFRELTEGRYADLEVDDEYDLVIHDEGEAFALERFSGGETDLANLCLRLAVSQVVAERAGTEGFGFLALDEIFGSQDEVRKGNILRALKGLSGRFRQILLVTHIADVKDSAEHVLRVEALDDGTSKVVIDA